MLGNDRRQFFIIIQCSLLKEACPDSFIYRIYGLLFQLIYFCQDGFEVSGSFMLLEQMLQ